MVGVRTVFPADVFDVIGALLPGIPRRCSDGAQHKSRVEARPLGTRGSLRAQIHNNCAFEVTQPTAVVIDTAHRTVEQCLADLHAALSAGQPQALSPPVATAHDASIVRPNFGRSHNQI